MKRTNKTLNILEKAEDKIGLVRQFRIFTFIVLFSIGWFIILGINSYVNKDIKVRLTHIASIYVNGISHQLKISNLSLAKKTENFKKFDSYVKNELLDDKNEGQDILLGLALTDKEGNNIYKSHKFKTGIEHNAEEILINKEEFEIIKIDSSKKEATYKDLLKGKNSSPDEIAKISLPVYSKDDKPIAIANLYIDTEFTKSFVRSSLIFISLGLWLGLIFLYLSLSWLFKHAHRRIENKNLELKKMTNTVISSMQQLKESYFGTMQALTMAVDAKDHYTAGHSFRVAAYAKEIAQELGFTEEAIDNLEKGARFHDIGKIGIRENVLNKKGELNKAEFDEMKRHTLIGAKIIEPIKTLRSIVPMIRSHHEKFDGRGYPDGIKGQAIPIEARIVAVADCFDAMTTDRPNRKAFPPEKAIEEIIRGRGKHFDSEVVDAFLKAYSGKTLSSKEVNLDEKSA